MHRFTMNNAVQSILIDPVRYLRRWLFILSLAACPALLPAQQVTDGSFELDSPSTTVPNGGVGWTPNTPNVMCYIYNNSFGHGITPAGSQFLYIGGGSGDSQTIAGSFVIGAHYQLYLQAADVQGGTLPSIILSVSGGATAQKTFTLVPNNAYTTNGSLALVTCELDFVPTSAAPITIFAGADSYPVAIDNVFIVPEPGTWTLLVGGVGVLGLAVRRARRA